jgi:hypothetical protein
LQLDDHSLDVGRERGERCTIRLGPNSDDQIGRDVCRKKPRSGQLTQPPLDAIPRYSRVSKSRDDQTDPGSCPNWMHERGSDGPNLEERGSDTLPLLRDTL